MTVNLISASNITENLVRIANASVICSRNYVWRLGFEVIISSLLEQTRSRDIAPAVVSWSPKTPMWLGSENCQNILEGLTLNEKKEKKKKNLMLAMTFSSDILCSSSASMTSEMHSISSIRVLFKSTSHASTERLTSKQVGALTRK